MRIRTVLCLLLASVLLVLCGCVGPAEVEYDPEAAAEMRNSRHLYLTVWSWQVASSQDARAYAQKAKECGFTAIDFAVLWSDFEPLKGHFHWKYLDETVKAFTDEGLKVSLQPLLWTKDLSWADELVLQKTAQGKIYEMEDRGSYLSFSDAATLSIVENTLQNFALHAVSTYGKDLTRWGVRLSCFGEFDYSVNEDLDYSEASIRGFYDYLREVYGSRQKVSDLRGLGASSEEEWNALPAEDVVDACYGDWRRYRQQCLSDVLDMMVNVYRSADPTVPILFSLGTYGNGMNTAYSGVVDLWSALEKHDVDIVGLSLCDGAQESMMLSLITCLTTKKISVEVDGAWALEEGRDVSSQVRLCGRYGVFSLSTANFTVEQLESHKQTLSGYPQSLATTQPLGDRDPTQGILILSNEIVAAHPPRSFDALYGDAWNLLSENGSRRVRFVTEAQIASGEISLEGVTTLYAGNINGSVEVSPAFAKALADTQTTVRGDLSFVFLDGTSPEGELADALAQRVSAE